MNDFKQLEDSLVKIMECIYDQRIKRNFFNVWFLQNLYSERLKTIKKLEDEEPER